MLDGQVPEDSIQVPEVSVEDKGETTRQCCKEAYKEEKGAHQI